MNKQVVGILLAILALCGLTFQMSYAYFSDQSVSSNNTFSAADVFPTAVPTGQTASLFNSDPFTCATGATSTGGPTFGSVTITKDASLDVVATITNGTPNSLYDLWVNQDPGSCPLSSPTVAVFITTDASGNGTNTLSDHPITPGATNYWVSLVGGGQVLRSTSVSF